MSDIDSGRLVVPVVADASGIGRDLQAKVDAAARNVQAKIGLDVDPAALRDRLKAAVDRAARNLTGQVKLDVDSNALGDRIKAAVDRAARGASAKVRLDVDENYLRQRIRTAVANASRAGGSAKVKLDVDATALRQRIEAAVRGASSRLAASITINVDLDIERAREQLEQFIHDNRNISIQVGIDLARARAQLDAFIHQRRSIDVSVRTSGGGDGGTGAISSGMSRLSSLLPSVRSGLIGLAVSAIPALAAAATGLVGALAPLSGALAAIPLVGAGIASAATAVFSSLHGVVNVLKLQKTAQDDATSSSGQAAAQQKQHAQAIQDATMGVRDAQERLGDAYQEAADRAEQADQQVEQAEQELAQTRQQVAQRAEEDARSIVDAERQVADAERSVEDAVRSLTQARETARRAIEALNQQTQQGALDERGAVLQVEEAQRSLQATQRDPRSDQLARQEAQLNYDQATQHLTDIRTQNQQNKEDAAKANREGVNGSDQVRSAQEAVLNAQEQLQLAVRGVDDARKQEARDAVDGQRQIAQAQQAVANAQRDQARAAVESQRSIRDAVEGVQRAEIALARAQEDSGNAGASAANKAAAAYAKLSPLQRKVVDEIHALKPAWDALSNAAQQGFLPGLIAAIPRASTLMRAFTPIVAESGRILGNWADQGSKLLTSGSFLHDYPIIGRQANDLLRAGTGFSLKFADALRNILASASPLTNEIVKLVDHFGDWLQKAAQGARDSGGLNRFFQTVAATIDRVFHILGQTGGILVSVLRQAAPLGQDLLGKLDGLVTKGNQWAKSVEGQQKIKQLFDNLRPAIDTVFRGIGILAQAIGQLATSPALPEFLRGVENLLRGLLPAVQPVLNFLGALATVIGNIAGSPGFKAFVKGLGDIVNAIADWWRQLANSTAFHAFINALGDAAGKLATIIGKLYASKSSMTLLKDSMTVLTPIMHVLAGLFDFLGKHMTIVRILTIGITGPFMLLGTALRIVGPVLTLIGHLLKDVLGFALTVLRNGLPLLKLAWNDTWSFIRNLTLSVVTWIVNFLASSWTRIKNDLSAIWNAIKLVFTTIWNGLRDVARAAAQWIHDFVFSIWHGIHDITVSVWNAIHSAFSAAWDGIKAVASASINFVRDTIGRGLDAVRNAFSAAVNAVRSIWNGIRDAAAAPVRFVVDTVYDNGIRAVVNKIAGWVGIHDLLPEIHFEQGGGVPGFATGGGYTTQSDPGFATGGSTGRVRGRRDDRKIDVTGGEHVLTPEETTAAGGHRGVALFRSMLMGGRPVRVGPGLGYISAPAQVKGQPQGFAEGGGFGSFDGYSIGGAVSSLWNNTGGRIVSAVASGLGGLISAGGGLLQMGAADAARGVLAPLRATAKATVGNMGNFGQAADGVIEKLSEAVIHFISGKEVKLVDAPGGGGAVERWRPVVISALQNLGLPIDDALVNGILSLISSESSGNPNAINLTDSNAAAGHPSQGLMQCTSLATEILTRRGWLRHDQVQVGDETIGYNPVTDRSEWTRITKVVQYDDEIVWRIGHRNWHADVTPNHRWFSDTRIGDTQNFRGEFIRTEDFKRRHRLRLAAVADTDGIPGLSREEVQILAWLQGDGHIRPTEHGWDGTIYQSKPEMVIKLRALLAGIEHGESVRAPRGNAAEQHVFRLRREWVTDLLKRSDVMETGPEAFVLALSPDQRAAWLAAMIDAEGHRMPGKREGYSEFVRIAQVDGPLQEAIRLAVFLEGFRPTYSANSAERNGYQPAGVIGMAKPHVAPSTFHAPKVLERQPVWCVKTDLETWTARLDGHIFITGNTIPTTFAANAGPYASRGITDPFANIYAGINYAVRHYGLGMLRAGGRHSGGGYIGYLLGGGVPGGEIPNMAEGGTLLPRQGGHVVRVAEQMRAETITDTATLNAGFARLEQLIESGQVGGGDTYIDVDVHNPIPETAGGSVAKTLRRQAALGVIPTTSPSTSRRTP